MVTTPDEAPSRAQGAQFRDEHRQHCSMPGSCPGERYITGYDIDRKNLYRQVSRVISAPKPVEERQLHKRLRKFGTFRPLYLFRVWSSRSARSTDDRTLNDAEAVTPPGFYGGTNVPQIETFCRYSLAFEVLGHVYTEKIPSVFSSWSPSFPFVIPWAIQKLGAGHEDVNVAILDTRRLEETSVAIYTPGLRVIISQELRKDMVPFEFLMYGAVRGHATVPTQHILDQGYCRLYPDMSDMQSNFTSAATTRSALEHPCRDFDEELAVANRVAELFAEVEPQYRQANAIYTPTRCEERTDLVQLLRSYSNITAAEHWRNDITILQDRHCALGGREEALRAVRVMRELVDRDREAMMAYMDGSADEVYDGAPRGAPAAGSRSEEESLTRGLEMSGKEGFLTMVRCIRVPGKVKSLYCNMMGLTAEWNATIGELSSETDMASSSEEEDPQDSSL